MLSTLSHRPVSPLELLGSKGFKRISEFRKKFNHGQNLCLKPAATQSIATFPFRAFFELFPLIRPRPYSICSFSENYAEILCAVVKYRSRMQRPRIGKVQNLTFPCRNNFTNGKLKTKIYLNSSQVYVLTS